MSNGISGFGTTVKGASQGEIGEVTRLSIPGQQASVIDVSTMKSPDGWREKIAGFKDARQLQIDMLYESENMASLLEGLGDSNEEWTVTLPDGSTFVCDGFIQDLGEAIPMDDKITQSMVIELSGKPVFTPASGA